MRDRLADPIAMAGDIVNDPDSFWNGAEIVSVTTRAQAIDDGVLIDLTRYAAAAGIRFPLAMTDTAWRAALCAPHADGKPSGIDVVRFVAWLREEMRRAARSNTDRFVATFHRIDRQTTILKAICGPGDRCEPVLTVMLPNED